MSQRSNAPYRDKILDDELSIIYEGHDVPKTTGVGDPKKYDQPRTTKTGKLTQNGYFCKAIDDYKNGIANAEIVRAYEKLFDGVWSEKGFFKLSDYCFIDDGTGRKVY